MQAFSHTHIYSPMLWPIDICQLDIVPTGFLKLNHYLIEGKDEVGFSREEISALTSQLCINFEFQQFIASSFTDTSSCKLYITIQTWHFANLIYLWGLLWSYSSKGERWSPPTNRISYFMSKEIPHVPCVKCTDVFRMEQNFLHISINVQDMWNFLSNFLGYDFFL